MHVWIPIIRWTVWPIVLLRPRRHHRLGVQILAQGTWTGSQSGVSKGTGGTICPLDGVDNNVSDSVSLTIRGTQTVQVDGPPTELAVPQNGMGDQPRLLDPFILSKFFFMGPNSISSNVFHQKPHVMIVIFQSV